MKPDFGLFAPKNVAPVIGMSMAATFTLSWLKTFMTVGPKFTSVWNSMT